jgi:hypothetical protein
MLKAEVIKVCGRGKGDWVSNIFGRLIWLIFNLWLIFDLNPMLVYIDT